MAFGGNHGRSGGGFQDRGPAWWMNQLHVPENYEILVRFIKGAYNQQVVDNLTGNVVEALLPYQRFVVHRIGGQRGEDVMCSGGDLTWEDGYGGYHRPCPSCELWKETRDIRTPRGEEAPEVFANANQKFAFTALDYSGYVESQRMKNGRPATRQDGKPVMEWRRADYPLTSPNYAGLKQQQGMVLPYYASGKSLGTIEDWDDRIGRSCGSCCTRDSIIITQLTCPQCNAILVDPDSRCTFSEFSAGENQTAHDMLQNNMFTAHTKPITCLNCHATVRPVETIRCANKACAHPTRARIFDVDVSMKSEGSGFQKRLVISGHSEPRPPQVPVDMLSLLVPTDFRKLLEATPVNEQHRVIERRRAKFGAPAQQPTPQNQYGQGQWNPPPGGAPQAPQGFVPPGFQAAPQPQQYPPQQQQLFAPPQAPQPPQVYQQPQYQQPVYPQAAPPPQYQAAPGYQAQPAPYQPQPVQYQQPAPQQPQAPQAPQMPPQFAPQPAPYQPQQPLQPPQQPQFQQPGYPPPAGPTAPWTR